MNQVTGFFQETKRKSTSKLSEVQIAPNGEHTIPLVTYRDGERRLLGISVINIDNGVMTDATLTLTEEVAQALGLYVTMETVNMPSGESACQVVVQNRMSIQKES